MKNKILLSTISAAALATAIIPVASLSSCSKSSNLQHPATPGEKLSYTNAAEWVAGYSKLIDGSKTRIYRANLAKSLDFNLSTSNLSVKGTGISTSYKKDDTRWIPITELLDLDYAITEKTEITHQLENERPTYSAVDILRLNNKIITNEAPSYYRFMDYLFNPFLYSDTFADFHKLSELNSSAFSEVFTKTEHNLYVTYNINDIAALLATKEVKALMESDTPMFVPIRGEGKASITFAFNKRGYLNHAYATIDSDNLELYNSPTSGKYPLRPVFYGKVKGQICYDATLKYFSYIPNISIVDATAESPVEITKPGSTEAFKWDYATKEEFSEGSDYYGYLTYQAIRVLPGYGSTVVLENKTANTPIDLDYIGFKIGNKTYTFDELGPQGSGCVTFMQYKAESGNYRGIFYIKPPMFDLCGSNDLKIVWSD